MSFKLSTQLDELNILKQEKRRLESDLGALDGLVESISLPKTGKLKITLKEPDYLVTGLYRDIYEIHLNGSVIGYFWIVENYLGGSLREIRVCVKMCGEQHAFAPLLLGGYGENRDEVQFLQHQIHRYFEDRLLEIDF